VGSGVTTGAGAGAGAGSTAAVWVCVYVFVSKVEDVPASFVAVMGAVLYSSVDCAVVVGTATFAVEAICEEMFFG
jgi:hypothetical protein